MGGSDAVHHAVSSRTLDCQIKQPNNVFVNSPTTIIVADGAHCP
jgi:hypothetical protein